jgi:hypothetical protein
MLNETRPYLLKGKVEQKMNRGDIWMIDLGGKAGKRPAIILMRQNPLEFLNKDISRKVVLALGLEDAF